MRINASGNVLEYNRYEDWEPLSEDDDVSEKYPTEIDPNSLDSYYFIFYRQ